MEKQLIGSLREKPFYKPLIISSVFVCLVLILWLGTTIVTSPKWLQIDDYVEYWAAGNLNLKGGNPYDPQQLLPLQHAAGRFFGVPVMMWNPPWMLLLAMPFSVFTYPLSRVLWILFFIIIILLSVNLTWQQYGGKPQYRWVGWLVGFTFLPVLEAFRTGQTGPLLLLGMAGFLYFYNKKRLWLAGGCLSLLLVKPHILYLVLIAVVLWSLYEKELRIILGAGITLAFATLVTWVVNPDVIQQYLFAAVNYPPEDWATPTIGGITRLLIGTQHFWLQFIPTLVGLLWISIYWYHRRLAWSWLEQAPLIILVSILTAAYGWTSDHSASLIPILQIFILLLLVQDKKRSWYLVLISYLVIEILLFVPFGNQIWNFWLAPSLLLWYLVSRRALTGTAPLVEGSRSVD